jgi:hypothetical protein
MDHPVLRLQQDAMVNASARLSWVRNGIDLTTGASFA